MRTQSDNPLFSVIVFSLDFDGCISPSHQNGAAQNRCDEMFKRIRAVMEEHPLAKIILMLGSARQTVLCDLYMGWYNKNGSAILYLTEVYKKFKQDHPNLSSRIELDTFLLEDILSNKDSGTHFTKRLNLKPHVIDTYLAYLQRCNHFYAYEIEWQDDSKHTLLYAQMHHIAKQYDNQKILFFFADNMLAILSSLQGVFHLKKYWIPTRMDLQLLHYDCGQFTRTLFSRVAGEGLVDHDFHHNTRSVDPRLQQDSAKRCLYDRRDFPLTLRHLISAGKVNVLAKFIEQCDDKVQVILQCESAWGAQETARFIEVSLSSRLQTDLIHAAFFRVKQLKLLACILPLLSPAELTARVQDAIDCENKGLLDSIIVSLQHTRRELPFTCSRPIVLYAFRVKNYALISCIAGRDFLYTRLIPLCESFDYLGFSKSNFEKMISIIFSNDYQSQLSMDLHTFCYQQRALSANQFNQDALITLHVILKNVQCDTFQNKLIAAIVFSQVCMQNLALPASEQCREIFNKVMHGELPKQSSREHEQVINMIEMQSRTIAAAVGDDMPVRDAYCALQFVMLSIDLSSQDVVKSAIDHWKATINTTDDGKTHEQLLSDMDYFVQRMKRSVVAQLRGAVAQYANAPSHIQFVNALSDRITVLFAAITDHPLTNPS